MAMKNLPPKTLSGKNNLGLSIQEDTKMNFKKLNFRAFCLTCIGLAVMLFDSCGSTEVVPVLLEDTVQEFTEKKLTNGIPVYFKQNKGSKIVVFRFIFEGGTGALDDTLGGLEDLTLDMMLRGSEEYPYEQIKQLQYEKSFSFSSSVGKDYSTVGFTCIQRDLIDVITIFGSCLMNPSLSEEDFKQKMKETSVQIARTASDPSGALSLALTKTAFAGHPYSTTRSVTAATYPNMNLDLVRTHYQELMNALRIKIVVVGNFSTDLIADFVTELETNFKSLSKKQFTEPKIPKIPFGVGNVKVANEQAGDSGYIAGFFPCPERTSADYVPFAILTMYLDDLFFSEVREKAGAVYSMNTGVIGGRELLGVISLYKASEKKNLKKTIMEAFKNFNATDLDREIDQYKNKYISSLYSPAQTASGVAASVVSGVEYFEDPASYLKRIDTVKETTIKQVIDAYKIYIEPIVKQDAFRWVIVDSEGNLSDYDFE